MIAATSPETAILVVEDGTIFKGKSFGSSTESIGELVFNTSMTGFQEALTDPSYAGQALVFSYPLVGNYGISKTANESNKVHATACIVSEACAAPNHYQSSQSIDSFLKEYNIPGVYGVDTRAIVNKIRSEGAKICGVKTGLEENEVENACKELLKKIKGFNYSSINFVQQVSTKEKYLSKAKSGEKKIALIDCGVKQSMVRELNKRGYSVIVHPFNATSQEILRNKPSGALFSNGPGDPVLMKDTVKTMQDLLGELPVFGICLGHQVMGLAFGAKTVKLKFGHRGGNHAVKETATGRTFITSQNHGYAVTSLPSEVEEWFVNCLDGTNEGLKKDSLRARSIQYHAEANPGPYDANVLFDEFLKIIGGGK